MFSETLKKAFETANEMRASDIHLKPGSPIVLRVSGKIKRVENTVITPEDISSLLREACGESSGALREGEFEKDFAFSVGTTRYRCNVCRENDGISAAIRVLITVGGSFEALRIPQILKTMAMRRNGLILITGPTGSGKSTTLTCVVNYLNDMTTNHIITIEDPIEYIHKSKSCVVTQREIGRDTESFAGAIRAAMREDPDVMVVGEMRDLESISAAITAAETGHLVLSTLHTRSAESTVDRIIDAFPSSQQNQIRAQLALTLIGVVSQQLLPGADGSSRFLASEVMCMNSAIRNIIRQGKTYMITSTIQTSGNEGMYLMRDSAEQLFREKKIEKAIFDEFQN